MAVTPKAERAYTKLSEFIAKVKDVTLARTEKFECVFKLPITLNETIAKMKDPEAAGLKLTPGTNGMEWLMSLMCEEVQIPGMVLQNKEVPIGPWNFMRNSNINFLGNEINITFLTAIDWKLRHLFEAWIAHCVNPTSKEIMWPDDQYGTIWINALDWSQDNNVFAGSGGDDDMDPLDPYYTPPHGTGHEKEAIVSVEKVMTQWELMEVTPKVLNLIPLGAMNVGIARTTLIISSAYWRSRTIDVDLGGADLMGDVVNDDFDNII